MARRWLVLGAYAAAIYTTLPYGPMIGRGMLRSGPGGWLLGPGMSVLAFVVGAAIVVLLWRRRARAPAYVALALAGGGTVLGLALLRAQHLERVHLPEYGIAAWLAWRALAAHGTSRMRGYVGGMLIAAALGLGDELLQAATPGRVYDIRDVLANALGAVLGTLVLVALHEGGTPAPSGTPQPAASDRVSFSAGS